jgi:hypothetical protein
VFAVFGSEIAKAEQQKEENEPALSRYRDLLFYTFC